MHEWNAWTDVTQRRESVMDKAASYRHATLCPSETRASGLQAQPNPQQNPLESRGFWGKAGDALAVSGVFGELKSSLSEAVARSLRHSAPSDRVG
jgi:hypothetical protein